MLGPQPRGRGIGRGEGRGRGRGTRGGRSVLSSTEPVASTSGISRGRDSTRGKRKTCTNRARAISISSSSDSSSSDSSSSDSSSSDSSLSVTVDRSYQSPPKEKEPRDFNSWEFRNVAWQMFLRYQYCLRTSTVDGLPTIFDFIKEMQSPENEPLTREFFIPPTTDTPPVYPSPFNIKEVMAYMMYEIRKCKDNTAFHRKDLISAMKLPDNEPLTSSEYWVITDPWKQDWERGVQVPVNPDSLPAPKVKIIPNPQPPGQADFKLPKDKYIHLSRDAHYSSEKHQLSSTPACAEAACAYDLDATDTSWLRLLNAERARAGAAAVTENQFEKVIEELEVRTWDKIQAIMKSEEGLGIEYDENVICDVCRSPDSEDGNEMVFCDSCNICVHQACYGITVIPEGQWLCRPCGDGVRPTCVLCPNQGGAMKCTPSGHKWAHVSCVLWIPEVSIGCAEKMEPITKISSIPPSRWSLLCVLCRERKGSCIQCSVKSCKTAYHVTCAFKHGLEMRAIIEDENADDGVKLRSYCQKHSVNSKKEKPGSGSEEEEVKRKRRKDMTSEEKTQARAARLHEIEKEFDKHVSVKDISSHLLDVDQDAINYIYNYWKLKRRSGHNRPLLPPKSDDNELLSHRQEQADLDKMKMFVQLRQDLERVRNLCYMVSRREKLSRSFFRLREQTFHKQMAVLSSGTEGIPAEELTAIAQANHGPSIYDTLYSHPDVAERKIDFDDLLAKIAPPDSNDDKKKDRNGLRRSKSSNPYRKHYVNGSRRSGSMYSGLSSEESDAEVARSSKYRARAIDSTTDEGEAKKKPSTSSPKKKISPKAKAAKISPKKIEKKKKKVPQSKAVVESSSEEDAPIVRSKRDKTGSKTLRQMEKEMTAGKQSGQSGTDSDELMPIRSTRSAKFPMDIYSDSTDDSMDEKAKAKKNINKMKEEKDTKCKAQKSPNVSDPQQSLPRTKAAMKEFIPSHSEKKESVTAEEKPTPKKRGRKPSNKEKKPPVKSHVSDEEARNKENKFSKPKDNPTDLIVPQRQAAKKASENMRSTSTGKKEENAIEKSPEEVKIKGKGKGKGKEIKSPPAKLTRQTSKDAEKETIAYVPQRQAAKKAAAHIKNIGSKVPAPETGETSKKKDEKPESSKSSEESAIKKTVDSKESSSSSSGSSSSSYSSSSSSEDEEPDKAGPKPAAKAREIKPIAAAKPPSLFSPPSARPTVDLPFLDKVSRPLSSTSASSDSDSHSDGSGSSSPTPKRPRRRRKHASDEASPRKAPETKLKTSEREPERGVSPSAAEREEPAGDAGPRAATRARSRSIAAGGVLPELSDAGSRKPSKDDGDCAATPDKTPKEGRQSGELPPPERKAHEILKDSPKEIRRRSSPKISRRSSTVVDRSPDRSPTHNNIKPKASKGRQPSVSEEKDKPPEAQPSPLPDKPSPRKNVDQRRKSMSSRRMSVKESTQKDTKDQVVPTAEEVIEPIKQRRQSRYDTRETKNARESISPGKKPAADKPQAEVPDKKAPVRINEEYNDSEKWLPKAPSPTHVLTPIERPGGNEKYMTDDKSFDAADVSTEKSSVKMIAKIQANLNENTMIKSPRTPMDARSLAPEEENPVKNLRKRSTLEAVTQQDASHVQGVEISKSAKIPSTVYHDRPPTSPQQKDNELFAFDMLAVDDGFNHDEIMKPFSSFPEFFFKEDSKEQGRQETLNLVDRLRMQLSAKKVPENCSQEPSTDDKDHTEDEQRIDDYSGDDYRGDDNRKDHGIDIHKDEDHRMQDVSVHPVEHNKHDGEPSPVREISQEMETHVVSSPTQHHNTMNHIQHSIAPAEMPRRKSIPEDKEYHPMAMTSNDKWHAGVGASLGDPHLEHESRQYEHNAYSEESETKEPGAVQPASDVGDTGSISKQSDDSQPSVGGVDNSNGTIDVESISERTHAYHNKEPPRGDCGTVSSPYAGLESQWRQSEIPRRRSSASSSDSEASGAREPHPPAGVMPEIDSYPPIPAYSCSVEPSMPLNQYATYPPDASPFLTTMSSLFGGGACSQLPLPSPGPLYAPQLTYSATGLLPPKPPYHRLCAAFTSSSQNIALTTAMIAPPTPKPLDSPSRDDTIDVSASDKFSIRASSPSICVDDSTYETSLSRTAKMSNDSNDTVTSVSQQECKSPAKTIPPLKLPIKFPGKSPGKSPGLSPKRSETAKVSKRSSNRNSRGQRGRGRSKSRGQGAHLYAPVDYLGDSIRNKLVGTVYDFEEEIANDGVDLKALRERRKSVDVRDDRRSEHSSQSPHIHSPHRASRKTPTVETKEYRAATEEIDEAAESADAEIRGFVHVPPLLPGPVDMRTYQPEAAPAGSEYLRPALAYTAAAAERHLADLEEEHAPPPTPAALPPAPLPPPQHAYVPLPRVSLSDSRNQLKVKIKGPFLDANYSASSAAPPAPPPAPPLEPPARAFNAVAAVSSGMAGSTSLRRMRKKELLRQYWTQDMNMDDPTSGALMGAAPPPAAPPPPRAVITIPKAVASMTSIPTREDYKIIEPPNVETKKKRKVSSGLSRELRHLKVTMNDEAEPNDEVKLSSLVPGNAHKRRARLSTKPAKAAPSTSQLTPKLKIKIGADTVPHVSEEPCDFRPPKKRHVHKPSLEDLRRESMKYRKMVMADFEENEKTTKHKLSKSEKRKKKKDKKADKLQIVNNESESAPKLIIKIKRPTAEGGPAMPAVPGPVAAASAVDPFDYDPSAPDPLALDTPCSSEGLSAMRKVRTTKVTPIRLKLARTQGSSYVMKGASPAPGAPAAAPPPPAPPDDHADVR